MRGGRLYSGFMQSGNPPFPRRRWIPAVILIGIGVLFLLDNLNVLSVDQAVQYWPILLIVLGVCQLIDRTVGPEGILRDRRVE